MVAFMSTPPLFYLITFQYTNPFSPPYSFAIRHALETTYGPYTEPSENTGFNPPKLGIARFELPPTNPNPYILPWAMRGLLEEPFVRERLGTEGKELLRMFEDWKPTTKQLKDVKFRLEAVRSKL